MISSNEMRFKAHKTFIVAIYVIAVLGITASVYSSGNRQKQSEKRQNKKHAAATDSVQKPNVIVSGIFAVKALNDPNGISFTDQTYSNPNISGVAPRISWNTIEPQENKFQWQPLDDIFTKAAEHAKKVVIIPVAGFDSPSWALQGAQTANFARKYGKGAGQISPLPLPWDQTYLAHWYSFLSALADRYGNNASFIMVGLSGPTSVSAEMSLPNTEKDIQQWVSLGYKPSRYESAWKQTFAAYAKFFPKQHFVLALYPGLPINEQGQAVHSAKDETRQAIINLGANNFPKQFALQTSGLNAAKQSNGAGGYSIVLSYSGRISTGFQMSTSASVRPANMGDASNPANALELSIMKGTQPNQEGMRINYLEIYEPDIINPDMQEVLAYGQKLLLSGSATAPPVSTTSQSTTRSKGRNKKQKPQDTNQIDDSDASISY
ncbi:MAG: hypothetical protein C5B54_08195 [Acidobacteria bacterium]|nr:MAG: hypothetical protein C5B54_08195 [Acidobacteriota bacterium]